MANWQSPAEFVNDLNTCYTFKSDNTILVFPELHHHNRKLLINATVGDIVEKLKALNTRKMTRSDNFPQWISKLNAHAIDVPLQSTIECMLSSGKYPALWKRSEISHVNKYFKPVALSLHCGKAAESYIVNKSIGKDI